MRKLTPAVSQDNLAVMSVGFLLSSPDDAVIWRGPKKNGLIKQFLRDVDWGETDYLLVDTPPGTSDEHLSVVQYLKARSVSCMQRAESARGRLLYVFGDGWAVKMV